jgi:hypothetical protein
LLPARALTLQQQEDTHTSPRAPGSCRLRAWIQPGRGRRASQDVLEDAARRGRSRTIEVAATPTPSSSRRYREPNVRPARPAPPPDPAVVRGPTRGGNRRSRRGPRAMTVGSAPRLPSFLHCPAGVLSARRIAGIRHRRRTRRSPAIILFHLMV